MPEWLHDKLRTSRFPPLTLTSHRNGSRQQSAYISCQTVPTHWRSKVRCSLCYMGTHQLDLRHVPMPWARQVWSRGGHVHCISFIMNNPSTCAVGTLHKFFKRLQPRERYCRCIRDKFYFTVICPSYKAYCGEQRAPSGWERTVEYGPVPGNCSDLCIIRICLPVLTAFHLGDPDIPFPLPLAGHPSSPRQQHPSTPFSWLDIPNL